MKKNTCKKVVVKSDLIPPPTKQEICDALLARVKQQFEDRQKVIAEEMMTARKAIMDEAKRILGNALDGKGQIRSVEPSSCFNDVTLTATIDSPELRSLMAIFMQKLKEQACHRFFDVAGEQRRIQHLVNLVKGERVRQMLQDPTTVKVLDTLLRRAGAIEAGRGD